MLSTGGPSMRRVKKSRWQADTIAIAIALSLFKDIPVKPHASGAVKEIA
jgi:hypothetical protein